jgi:hypothetical protein
MSLGNPGHEGGADSPRCQRGEALADDRCEQLSIERRAPTRTGAIDGGWIENDHVDAVAFGADELLGVLRDDFRLELPAGTRFRNPVFE